MLQPLPPELQDIIYRLALVISPHHATRRGDSISPRHAIRRGDPKWRIPTDDSGQPQAVALGLLQVSKVGTQDSTCLSCSSKS